MIIHHTKGIDYNTYKIIWENFIQEKKEFLLEKNKEWKRIWAELFSEESMKKKMAEIQKKHLNKTGAKKMNTCPFCGRASLSERKTKKPKYRCLKCGKEFSEPKFRIPQHYYLKTYKLKQLVEKWNNKEIINRIIEQYYDELKKQYLERVDVLVEEYLSMSDTLVLCKNCHFPIEKGMVLCPGCKEHYIYPFYERCKACENNQFFKQNEAEYVIERSENHYVIRSIYDKNLVKIIKEGLWYGKKWYPKQKIWCIEEFAFCQIQKRILDYLACTGKLYKLDYIEEGFYQEVINKFKSKKNYKNELLTELPQCNDEMEGYCNHAGEFVYGERNKCNKLYCDCYFPIIGVFKKLSEIITKLHIIENIDLFCT